MAINAPKEFDLDSMADLPAMENVRHDSPQQADGRLMGQPGTAQSRSQSMPSIKKIKNLETTSLLQKRAQTAVGDLRLPSFKSLGIGLPRPERLLTPPDEADYFTIDPLAIPHQPIPIPRSAPTLPTIHIDSANQTTPPQESDADMTPGSTQKPSGTTMAESSQSNETMTQNPSSMEPVLERHHSSSSEEETPRGPAWLDRALDAVVTNIPSTGNTLVCLCQCQPCPISPNSANVTTAFTSILGALQANLGDGQYIDVTHAVPPQFNMALLPSSPMGTPNPISGQSDYFSMSVFPKAAVALHHSDALKFPVPSSPHPVVPPNSVGVSLLERYIPPSTAQEFLDLFSTDAPSALVDRLTELSPDGGSLVFIYPTFNGASTFASRYVGPLLDPHLRTMVSIHGLTTDLSQDIGKLASVDTMFSFEKLARKITFLLPRLGRIVAGSTTTRRYSLVHASKQVVNVTRDTWTEWWLQQEASRIREVVRKYYKRGSRLPERGSITEGGLAREVLDGVKGRSYGPYDKPLNGIEVGVFVIKRTA